MPKFLISVGVVLIALSVIGLAMAIANLASLPLTQQQLSELMPDAGAAVKQAVAQSRNRSYVGIIVSLAALMSGIIVTRRGITRRTPTPQVP